MWWISHRDTEKKRIEACLPNNQGERVYSNSKMGKRNERSFWPVAHPVEKPRHDRWKNIFLFFQAKNPSRANSYTPDNTILFKRTIDSRNNVQQFRQDINYRHLASSFKDGRILGRIFLKKTRHQQVSGDRWVPKRRVNKVLGTFSLSLSPLVSFSLLFLVRSILPTRELFRWEGGKKPLERGQLWREYLKCKRNKTIPLGLSLSFLSFYSILLQFFPSLVESTLFKRKRRQGCNLKSSTLATSSSVVRVFTMMEKKPWRYQVVAIFPEIPTRSNKQIKENVGPSQGPMLTTSLIQQTRANIVNIYILHLHRTFRAIWA